MPRKAKLVAVEAFDPPTYAHLRMFERAKEFLEINQGIEIVEGIMSVMDHSVPESSGSASIFHRLKMLKLALKDSRWIRADKAPNNACGRLQVLEYVDGIFNVDHEDSRIATIFLCSMHFFDHIDNDDLEQLQAILSKFDTIVICSSEFVSNSRPGCPSLTLKQNQKQLYIVHDFLFHGSQTDVIIRETLRHGESVRYCTSDSVIAYIQEHNLYSRRSTSHNTANLVVNEENNEDHVKEIVSHADLFASGHSLPTRRCDSPLELLQMLPAFGEGMATSTVSDLGLDRSARSRREAESATASTYPSELHRPLSEERIRPPRPSARKPKHCLCDDSCLTTSLTAVPNAKNVAVFEKNPLTASTISFTFEQHNLLYTPETTV